jgi:flavin reductase (DIM6/NTAB) family NADH-FMN oxidoreductase RutF
MRIAIVRLACTIAVLTGIRWDETLGTDGRAPALKARLWPPTAPCTEKRRRRPSRKPGVEAVIGSLDSAFGKLVSELDYSLFIVTAARGGERAGCLIGFASQVSIHPPRFLACLSVKNRTYRLAREADTLIVHPVPEEADYLARLFGGETGDEVDKFSQCAWAPGPGGAPVLSDLANWFAGRVLERIDFGDHVGFLLEPGEVHAGDSQEPFTFRRGRWIDPGHEP